MGFRPNVSVKLFYVQRPRVLERRARRRLGHQCIGDAYGATVDRAGEIRHGKTSMIHHDGKGVFAGLPNPFEAVRYHSLVIYPDTVPDFLEVAAWTDNGLIMGVRHKELPVEGIQFHPESIMTLVGHDLLQNYLNQVEEFHAAPEGL